jgi:type I restriction enzyme S subunit
MLLRWTSAIKEKSEKLLGGQCRTGYLEKGIVGPRDSYVIAVNSRRLRGVFASLNGISQFPFAVEAAFAIGPYQLHIDRESLLTVKENYQHRPYLKNATGADVPAYTFLDEHFAAVSAIWATDFDDCSDLGNQMALAIIHNPLATNPLPVNLLPAWSEYVATAVQIDQYQLDRQDGRLALQHTQ